MPSEYNEKAISYAPQSAKVSGKGDKIKVGKDGKINKEETLKNASELNPVPVIIKSDGNIADFVIKDQNENGVQVYTTGIRKNDATGATEARLARSDEAGNMVAIGWIDVSYVVCGSLVSKTIDVEVKSPVQSEPNTIPELADEDFEKTIRSFVFFDPYMNGEENIESSLKSGLGLQREIAKFLGLYDGSVPYSEDEKLRVQEKINNQIHLVPFNDIPDEYIERFPEMSRFKTPGINGQEKDYNIRFRDYWNNNVAVCNIAVLIIHAHANANLFCLFGGVHGFNATEFESLGFNFPRIDYAVFSGCNLGNTSYTNNVAKTFADHTAGGNPVQEKRSLLETIRGEKKRYWVYPTAVIAADGNTSSTVIELDGFVTGLVTRTSKYDPKDNGNYTMFIEGLGYCVYIRGESDPTPIPETASEAVPEDEDAKWIEKSVSVQYLLEEAKKIVLEKGDVFSS